MQIVICYEVPKAHQKDVPHHIQNILALRKYFGVATNVQLDSTEGKGKISRSYI
jgi:hypothetical protein